MRKYFEIRSYTVGILIIYVRQNYKVDLKISQGHLNYTCAADISVVFSNLLNMVNPSSA